MQEQNKDLLALKALAEKATPIDTDLYGDRYMQGAWSRADFTAEQDAFYNAANPAAILSLIARIEQAEATLALRTGEYEEANADRLKYAARIAELERIAHNAVGYVKEMESASPAVDLSGLTRYGFGGGLGDDFAESKDGPYVLFSDVCALVASAPVVREGVMTDEQREAVRVAIAEALGEAYDCTRVWSAWSYGTMGPDDFSLVAEDDGRVAEIAEVAISAIEREVLATGKTDAKTYDRKSIGIDGEFGHLLGDYRAAHGDRNRKDCRKRLVAYIEQYYATPSTPSQAWEGELPELPKETCCIELDRFDEWQVTHYSDRGHPAYDERKMEAYVRKAIGAAVAAKEHVVQQAQIWAQEARTQRATVLSILRHFGLPEHDWEVLRLIRSLSSNPVSLTEKWISVEERLPVPGSVVVAWHDDSPVLAVIEEEFLSGQALGISWRVNGKALDPFYPPSHWMPTPHPASNGNGEKGDKA